MKFQCILCQSTYKVERTQFGTSINCPNCNKKLVVPKKNYDRGRVIGGDFVIDRILGTGGMGTVYLARQISLERDVALKILAQKFSIDPKFRLDFQREARAASRLTHSNLVQAYAFGEDESDLFLAMEYVEGVTLGDRLDNETRLAIDEAMNIVQQIAEGLHFAWTQEQLIHRDIKPDNIMLTPDGHVKLTDMGLARTIVELENVTEVSGTPAYMNPEQFTKQAMDCRADIYSLGVCLFHSVTGQLPFDSPNVRELARQHIQDKLEFPHKTVDLPTDIKKLLRKMMAKEREDRQIDHEALLHEIYSSRLKLDQSSTHVPSVHTLSFNRYDFKNQKLHKKSSDSDTQVSSTKQLPRKKIKPLSSVTTSLTSSFSTTLDESRGNNFFINNLFALLAIIAAIILAMLWGGDSESRYYQETQTLLKKVNNELKTPGEILNAVDGILNQKIADNLNKDDFYAHNTLLQIKVRYLKQQQDLQLEKVKEVQNALEELKKRNRQGSAEQKKKFDLISEDLQDAKKQLTLARKKFRAVKASQSTAKQSTQNSYSFAKSISDDMKTLEFLWEREKKVHLVYILKKLNAQYFTEAQEVLQQYKASYQGMYSNWFKQQLAFIKNAKTLWETVEENLQVLKNTEALLDDGGPYTIDKVYPGSGELEYYDDLTVATIKISALEPKYLVKLYEQICSINNIKEVGKAAYAVSKFDFNMAFEIAPKDKRVIEYANIYLKQRISQIKRYADSGDTEKAEELANKTYLQCNNVIGIVDIKKQLYLIFGENVINGIIEED